LNLAIIIGANPVKIKTIAYKFPVVTLYALIISLNEFLNNILKIVSNIIVAKIHKIPILIYIFFVPFPNRGINIKETIKTKIHKINPLIGLEIFYHN